MSSYPLPKIVFIAAGASCLIGFIAGYFIGIYTRTKAQCDAWYVFDSCMASCLAPALHDQSSEENEEIMREGEAQELQDITEEKKVGLFYGKLAGFSLMDSAIGYMNNLQQRGIAVSIKTHRYRSNRGRIREWYQVVTDPLSYDETNALVEKIAEEDRLKEATICAYIKDE